MEELLYVLSHIQFLKIEQKKKSSYENSGKRGNVAVPFGLVVEDYVFEQKNNCHLLLKPKPAYRWLNVSGVTLNIKSARITISLRKIS